MLEMLQTGEIIAGTRTLSRAIAAGGVKHVYLAEDADVFITRRVQELCQQYNVPYTRVATMKELGQACHIQVGAACAGVK